VDLDLTRSTGAGDGTRLEYDVASSSRSGPIAATGAGRDCHGATVARTSASTAASHGNSSTSTGRARTGCHSGSSSGTADTGTTDDRHGSARTSADASSSSHRDKPTCCVSASRCLACDQEAGACT